MVLGESPQAAKKSIQDNTQAAVGSVEILAEFRYVSAKTLSVRQNPKARSPEVSRLSFGMAVRLLKKDKDFALVIWTDKESGVEIQGWVFSRYLGKFN
jgi:Bacterial SH3 domain